MKERGETLCWEFSRLYPAVLQERRRGRGPAPCACTQDLLSPRPGVPAVTAPHHPADAISTVTCPWLGSESQGRVGGPRGMIHGDGGEGWSLLLCDVWGGPGWGTELGGSLWSFFKAVDWFPPWRRAQAPGPLVPGVPPLSWAMGLCGVYLPASQRLGPWLHPGAECGSALRLSWPWADALGAHVLLLKMWRRTGWTTPPKAEATHRSVHRWGRAGLSLSWAHQPSAESSRFPLGIQDTKPLAWRCSDGPLSARGQECGGALAAPSGLAVLLFCHNSVCAHPWEVVPLVLGQAPAAAQVPWLMDPTA